MNSRNAGRRRWTMLSLAALLTAGTTLAQGTIEVRSARITLRNADVAAQTISRQNPWLRTPDAASGVARFPTVVLGTATYTMTSAATLDGTPQLGDPRIAAVDLLPAAFNGDSLANLAENFPGDPTQAGTIGDDVLPGIVTTDSLRFTGPLTSPFVGVAGPGSSPGVAGPGFIPTQGVVGSGSLFGGTAAPGVTAPPSSSTGLRSLRRGSR